MLATTVLHCARKEIVTLSRIRLETRALSPHSVIRSITSDVQTFPSKRTGQDNIILLHEAEDAANVFLFASCRQARTHFRLLMDIAYSF
jgi:hypothetical protein